LAEPVVEKIKQSLTTAETLYYRLVLLVGQTGTGKTRILQDLAKDYDSNVINVNLAISSELIQLTAKQRILRLQWLLLQLVENFSSIVILDNIEILFDKNLQQDPLKLLQSISRNHSVIASWNGTTSGGKLIYAEQGHPEYRCYDLNDLQIVSAEGKEKVYSN
jgi:Cdc6-like AAA superfamily ATPase